MADDIRLRSAKRRVHYEQLLTDHYRGLWVKESDWHEKHREGLVWMYKRDPVLVTEVCDKIIDPSGALLNRIRQAAEGNWCD